MLLVSEEGARRYQELLVPLMFGPSARQLVANAALKKGAHVLDIATGTGIVARAASEIVSSSGKVTALDIAEGMLTVARSQPAVPGAAPIEYIQSAAEEASLPEAAFDVVFCHQGLQFFDEPIRALKLVRQAIRPEGRLHIALWRSLEEHPLAGSMQNALLECGLDDLTWFLAKAYRLHDPALVTSILQQSGFAVEKQKRVDVRPDEAWEITDGQRLLMATPLAPKLTTLTEEQRAALSAANERQLARYSKDGKLDLHFPATFYIARPA